MRQRPSGPKQFATRASRLVHKRCVKEDEEINWDALNDLTANRVVRMLDVSPFRFLDYPEDDNAES